MHTDHHGKESTDGRTQYFPTAVGGGRDRRHDRAGRPVPDVRILRACDTYDRSEPSDAAVCCCDATAKHRPDHTETPHIALRPRFLHTISFIKVSITVTVCLHIN